MFLLYLHWYRYSNLWTPVVLFSRVWLLYFLLFSCKDKSISTLFQRQIVMKIHDLGQTYYDANYLNHAAF
jgi:hypothetical protein